MIYFILKSVEKSSCRVAASLPMFQQRYALKPDDLQVNIARHRKCKKYVSDQSLWYSLKEILCKMPYRFYVSSNHFQDIMDPKGPMSWNCNFFILLCPRKSLCPANYCIKHISVSMRIRIHTHFSLTFAPNFRVEIAGPFRQCQFRLALVNFTEALKILVNYCFLFFYADLSIEDDSKVEISMTTDGFDPQCETLEVSLVFVW